MNSLAGFGHSTVRRRAVAETVPIEDLPSMLHPVHAADLTAILLMTPAGRRPYVALAFADLTPAAWSRRAGFDYNGVTIGRWLNRQHAMPLGGALRLAKVLGVPAEELFKGWA